MKVDIEFYEAGTDDKPMSLYDWDQVKQAPNPPERPPHFTPGEVAKCGMIGVGLFVVGFGLLAAAFLYL